MRNLIPVAVLLSLLLMEIKQGSWIVDFSINSAERKVSLNLVYLVHVM